MGIIFGLFLLLLATRVFAQGARLLRLPASVGELGAGAFFAVLIAFGGPQLEMLEDVVSSPELGLIAEAGIFFLVLQAGVDMKPASLQRRSKDALVIALGGALVPFMLGCAAGYFLFPDGVLKIAQCAFLGVVLSITSIPASVKILQEQGALAKPFGQAIVTAAIFDDVLGLFLLALLTLLMTGDGALTAFDFGILGAKSVLFFGVTILLGVHIYPRISARLRLLDLAAVEFSTLMIVALGYGLFAELMGLHWIMGAFMAGLFFEPERVGTRAYDEMRIVIVGITGGVLGPLFFASIGLALDFSALAGAPLLVVLLVMIGFGGKFAGAFAPARLMGFETRDAAAIGAGMGARGAVELVVISIALSEGLFAQSGGEVISALIATTVLSTIVAALLLRWLVQQDMPEGEASRPV